MFLSFSYIWLNNKLTNKNEKTALFLATITLVSACSTSNDSTAIDPISSQPYTPLANFSELTPGEYQYVGNDIGNGVV